MPAVPEDAAVYFKNVKDGATVSASLKIEMGAENIIVDTAGPVISGRGHHHLLIDAGESIPAGTIIPMDAAHMHFGKGQTETEINLSPGKHTLTLQFADGLHRSYGTKMAKSIIVDVKK